MAIISISRGCYSHGKQIAEEVARKLGYECVNREIILDVVKEFNISEIELLKSLEEAPGFINKLTHGKEKYLSYFRAALLEHVKTDNVLYHGHAGHLLLPPIGHLLRVRIIANMDMRVANLRKTENLLPDEAMDKLRKEDLKRQNWTRLLYNKDVWNPELYDMVIHIENLTISDACDLICIAAKSSSLKTCPVDANLLRDVAISTHIHAALQDICDADVTSHNGNVKIVVSPAKIRIVGFGNLKIQDRIERQQSNKLNSKILKIAYEVPGVQYAVCDISRYV